MRKGGREIWRGGRSGKCDREGGEREERIQVKREEEERVPLRGGERGKGVATDTGT